MKFHLGYYIRTNDHSTYHYSSDESPRRTLCGLGGSSWGEAATPFTAHHQLRRWQALHGRKHERRYCKNCLRMMRNARDIVTRLAEIVE